MPPKRKAVEPKVDNEVKTEAPKSKRGRKKEPDAVEEIGNGDVEPTKKVGRGRQAKKVEEVSDDAQKPEPKKGAKGRAKKEKVIENDEDTEEVEPKKAKGRTKKQNLPEADVAEEDEPKKTKGRQKKQPVEKIVEDEDEEKPKKGRGRQKKQKEADVEEEQEMDDADKNVENNDVEEKPKKGRGRLKKTKQIDVEDDKEKDEAEIVEDDVEEKPKKGRGRQKKQTQADVEDDQELDEHEVTEDDVKVEEKPKKGRGRQKKQKETEVEDDQEIDDEVEKKEKPGTKRGRGKQANLKDASDADEESAVSKPKRGRKKVEEVEKAKPTLMNKTDTDYSNIDFSCTKTNKDGDEANFIVSSWNVDGLRAWVKKNGIKYIQAENADILCLQETKCSQEKLPEEITEIDGYKKYWASSKKDGYAGVALFSKVMPIDVKYGIGNENHDEEGRCITAEFKKFFVVSVYVPNAGRKLVTLSKRMEWNDLFMKFVQDLDKIKPVIICGDMNVAHSEIDLSNPKTNKKNAGFTQEERDGMTEFLECGFVDTYRKLYPDKENAYTFWSYMMNARSKNVGWRLDYFLLSERLVDSVCDIQFRNTIYGSDHCPITLFLNIK